MSVWLIPSRIVGNLPHVLQPGSHPALYRFTFRRGVRPFLMMRYISLVNSTDPNPPHQVIVRTEKVDDSDQLSFQQAYCMAGLVQLPLAAVPLDDLGAGAYTFSVQLSFEGHPAGEPITGEFAVDVSRPYAQSVPHVPLECHARPGGGGACGLCSGHGQCTHDGWCVCYGGWFGDTCWHDAQTAEEYLPEEHPASAPWACAQVRAPASDGYSYFFRFSLIPPSGDALHFRVQGLKSTPRCAF